MIRQTIIGACLVIAAQSTTAGATDPRLVTTLFDPDRVVRISSQTGVQSTIAFGEDEHIENVAVGDSAAWQVTPNKRANLLFVKPLSTRARTNMTVVTDRHTYLFDLVASSGSPIYVLRFRYPEKAKALTSDAIPATASLEEQAAVDRVRQETSIPAAPLSTAWKRGGSAKLLPASIHDDSTDTFLVWPAGTPVPAILIKDEKGAEGPVNYSVRDGAIVVEGVPPLIVLRSGREVASLERLPVEMSASATQKELGR